MQEFLSIAILGAILSVIIQAGKDKLGVNSLGLKLITIGLSIVVGVVYVYLQQTGLLETVYGVLAGASTVYALLLRKTES